MNAAAVPDDTRVALRRGKLKYARIDRPGITRKKAGKRFNYFDPNGRRITEAAVVAHINSLAIPPAYCDVWISPHPRGHIQAIGIDARGRKQYRYHPDWRAARDQAKYDHVIDFARALPAIRQATASDLRKRGLPKDKVLAAVVKVMEKTLIRVGNDEYAKANHSYGLTTLQDDHAEIVSRRKVVFHFRGKSGVEHEIDLCDPQLARITQECKDLPGQELFQYQDAQGKVHDINSTDVNDYLRRITGQDFTAKDYRTWAGTVLAATALDGFEQELAAEKGLKKPTKKRVKQNMIKAIESVAARLGNTKAVCRKCYIHPAVLDAYLDGDLAARLKHRAQDELNIARKYALDADEERVLKMLEKTL